MRTSLCTPWIDTVYICCIPCSFTGRQWSYKFSPCFLMLFVIVSYSVTKSCQTLCDAMDCNMSDSLSLTISCNLMSLPCTLYLCWFYCKNLIVQIIFMTRTLCWVLWVHWTWRWAWGPLMPVINHGSLGDVWFTVCVFKIWQGTFR